MAKKYIPLIIVFLISLLAGYALLHPGLPPTHDGEYHVVRFYEFYQSLLEGVMYPRWAANLNNGYGVPLFNYVYPLPNYVAALLHSVGFSFIDAFKLNMFLATILGAFGMYFLGKEFWGKTGGVVSAIFYTFAPYRFVDIYIRGSVGEVWAFAFMPFFLWQLQVYSKEKQSQTMIIASIMLALIILSHNIVGLMFFTFSLAYSTFLLWGKKQLRKDYVAFLKLYLLGLCLSAIFWLPALVEKEQVVGLQIYNTLTNFPELYQLLIPSWGSGFAGGGLQDQMSVQIGVANMLAIGIAIVAYRKSQKKEDKKLLLFFLISFFITLVLLLRWSWPIWQVVPLLLYFQFPWRLLSLVIVICAFLAGSTVVVWKSKIPIIVLSTLCILLSIGYAKPAFYHMREDSHYLTRANFIHGTNSPGDSFNTKWFNTALKKQNTKIRVIRGDATIRDIVLTSNSYHFAATVRRDARIQLHTAYFPGWTLYIDDKKIKTTYNKDGVLEFTLPKGDHTVFVRFEDTIIRKIAIAISLTAILYVLGTLYITIKRHKK